MRTGLTALLLFILTLSISSTGHSQIDPCIASSAYKIVVLGSSTAAGTGPSTPDSTWVNRYRNYLQSINPANEVVNLAVGGYNTYRIMPTGFVPPPNRPNPDDVRNITAALAESPDAIIVNMPSNDVALNFTYTEQMFNLDTIVQIATAASVPIWICTTQPRNFSAAQAQLQWDLKDSILAQFAPNVIDFWTNIATPSYFIDPIYDSGDGVHLNDAAHNILESRVIAANILQNAYTPPANPDPAILNISPYVLSICGDFLSAFYVEFLNFGPNDSLPVSVYLEFSEDQFGIIDSSTYNFPNGLEPCSLDTLQIFGNTFYTGDYTATAIISSVSNSNYTNDTLTFEFSTLGHPMWSPHNDTLCEPDYAVLSVTIEPQDTAIWYPDAMSPIPIAYGSTFQTPLITSTSDWYVEIVRGDLHYSDNLFTTNNSNINFNGIMFDLIGHEDIYIDSFDVKINTTGTQIVEIYQKSGSHIGFESDPSAWTLVDAVSVDVLDPTIQTHVPFPSFFIPQDDTVGIYVKLGNSASNLSYQSLSSPLTRSTNEMTMITGSGVNFSMTNSYYPRDWNGRVYYHYGERLQGDCYSGRFPVTAYLSEIPFESIQDTIIDIQDTLLITSTSGMSNYEWTDGSTGSSYEFVASQFGNGIHFVTVSAYDSLGCFHMDTVIVGVADLVSVDELALNISVSPNPTTGIVQFSNPTIDYVEIFSVEGKFIERMHPINGIIDISLFQSGYYYLRFPPEARTQDHPILKIDQ